MKKQPEPLCPLLAKDSEWVDILQTSQTDAAKSSTNVSDEEEVLQLVNYFVFIITFRKQTKLLSKRQPIFLGRMRRWASNETSSYYVSGFT